jgi:equilibrative nucleoside transporter 1/2/3
MPSQSDSHHVTFSDAKEEHDDPEDIHERTALFKKKHDAPEDKHNMAYYIFFLLGIGSLLPWNAFITASAYYRNRFCGTDYVLNFEAWFSVAYSLSSEVSLVFVVLYRYTAVLYPLYIFATIFVFTSVLVLFPNINGNDFFYITITSMIVVGTVASMVRSGVFTLAGRSCWCVFSSSRVKLIGQTHESQTTGFFPPQYTQAVMGGIGMGGVIVSVLCIITTAGSSNAVPLAHDGCLSNQSIDWSTFMYFVLSSVVLVSNIVGYLMLKRLPITKYYEGHGNKMVRPLLIADSVTIVAGEGMSLRQEKITVAGPQEEEESAGRAALRVLKIVELPAFSIFFVFVITYSVYPGLTTLIAAKEGSIAKFFAPGMFLLFNIGDLCGRLSCASLDVHGGGVKLRSKVAVGTLLRFIFIPAFMLCNVTGSVFPVVFSHDIWPFVIMGLFSYSSGLLATMSMMIAPTLVMFDDKKVVGSIMTLLLSTGLLAGSCASFLSLRIATGSW